jgi:hypothetical protein
LYYIYQNDDLRIRTRPIHRDRGSTHICIEMLQNNKYNEYMLLLYNTIYYEDSIIYMILYDTILYDTPHYDQPNQMLKFLTFLDLICLREASISYSIWSSSFMLSVPRSSPRIFLKYENEGC